MILTTRPLIDRHWVGAKQRTRSQFTASWRNTLDLLEREVSAVQTRAMADPVLMMDITESDLRIDGQVRANARPSSDAVAISFESTKGPLVFRSDRFNERPWGYDKTMSELWKHNLRAIALTLEALRKVERYGAVMSDEQYTGFRQLASAPAVVELGTDQAWAVLRTLARVEGSASKELVLSRARRYSHPDAGGTTETWAQFDTAYKVVMP